MSILSKENKQFSAVQDMIDSNPKMVDVKESVEMFKKRKAIAMMSDYIQLYPKMYEYGYRNSVILDELLTLHNITLMSFRNFIKKEGVPMTRLRKIAQWNYKKRLDTVEKYRKTIDGLMDQATQDPESETRLMNKAHELTEEMEEFVRLNKL